MTNRIRSRLKHIIETLVVYSLTGLRKIRGFESGFEIYCPNFFNKRELLLWRLKVINPLFNKDTNFRKDIYDETPLEIVIPISLKDIFLLNEVSLNALKFIKHPIKKIYVIGEANRQIIDVCEKLGLAFIDETLVLGYNKSRIDYVVDCNDRSGWLFQQLLKLGADKIVETENFLVLDADTIFVKPKVFFYKGKLILDQSEERHEVYHKVYQKLLKRATSNLLSFVTHNMVFNKKHLCALKLEIERIHSKPWDKAIIDCVDYDDASGFSEYELYGNFLFNIIPDQLKREFWFNTTSTVQPYPFYIKTVSLHSYLIAQ